MLRRGVFAIGRCITKPAPRTYATLKPASKGKQKELSGEDQLEQDAARILRVVEQRVEERERLIKETVSMTNREILFIANSAYIGQ
jgi:hypothetical protein